MINSFDKTACRLLAEEAEKALRAVAERHGLAFAYKGGNFSNTTFVLKGEFAVRSEGGEAQTREVADFRRYASMFGLQAEDFGKAFASNGRSFKISGLRPSAPKYNLIATDLETGKAFKFVASVIAAKLHPKAL